jgi:hypothetical protein
VLKQEAWLPLELLPLPPGGLLLLADGLEDELVGSKLVVGLPVAGLPVGPPVEPLVGLPVGLLVELLVEPPNPLLPLSYSVQPGTSGLLSGIVL